MPTPPKPDPGAAPTPPRKPEPTTDKKEAGRRHQQAVAAWKSQVESIADQATRGALEGVTDSRLRDVLALHAPHVGDFDSRATCLVCIDPNSPYYESEPAPWPCATVRAATSDDALPPQVPDRPTYDEFYVEPEVTVTLAHHSQIDGKPYLPRERVTLSLSRAYGLRRRLLRADRNRIEKEYAL